jgi:hypothetical protein
VPPLLQDAREQATPTPTTPGMPKDALTASLVSGGGLKV